MSELKPCPFCGGEAKFAHIFENPDKCMISCRECDGGIDAVFANEDEAAEYWNRRAQPANNPLTLDELRGMDGEPVYIVGRHYSGWTVPWRNAAKYIARCPDEANISYYPKDYGKTWLAYRAKPEGSEGNEL